MAANHGANAATAAVTVITNPLIPRLKIAVLTNANTFPSVPKLTASAPTPNNNLPTYSNVLRNMFATGNINNLKATKPAPAILITDTSASMLSANLFTAFVSPLIPSPASPAKAPKSATLNLSVASPNWLSSKLIKPTCEVNAPPKFSCKPSNNAAVILLAPSAVLPNSLSSNLASPHLSCKMLHTGIPLSARLFRSSRPNPPAVERDTKSKAA